MEHGQLTSDVRRWAAVITLAAIATATVIPSAAFAKDPKPGKQLCEVTDEQLTELSGLVARDDGYVAIGDGSAGDVTTVNIVGLDDKCANAQNGAVGQLEPSDPEDLAIDAEGNFWVADTGDNRGSRPTIALHKIALGGEATTYRFTYPGGDKFDCEALLLQSDGTPIFATKEIGKSVLYKPTAELNPDGDVALEKAASISVKATKTEGGPEEVNGIPLGDAPSRFVTGGAVSPDGKKAVLRTYTDAYEWTVKDDDVAKSIADGKPTVTPLPGEPQGEAITYSADGKKFVTGSEAEVDQNGSVTQNPRLWSYTPTEAADSGSGDKKDAEEVAGSSLLGSIIDTLGPSGILWVIAGVGVVGLIMVIIGGRVIWRARRQAKERQAESSDADDRSSRYRDDEPSRYHDDGDIPRYRDDDDRPRYRDQDDGLGGGRLFESSGPVRNDDYDDWRRRDEPRSGNVYGGRDEPRSGSVYGGGREEPRSGNVYGDRDEPRSGNVYGGRSGRGGFDDEPGSGTVYGGRR